jgi:hypothetical protein
LSHGLRLAHGLHAKEASMSATAPAPEGAWVLARLVAGEPVERAEVEALGAPWREIAQRVLGEDSADRLAAGARRLGGAAR